MFLVERRNRVEDGRKKLEEEWMIDGFEEAVKWELKGKQMVRWMIKENELTITLINLFDALHLRSSAFLKS